MSVPIRVWLSELTEQFGRQEAMDILFHSLGTPWSSTFLMAHQEQVLNQSQTRVCESIQRRRSEGEPLAYILERCYFYDLPLRITRDVLIPRPDTEVLVNVAHKLVSTQSLSTCLDLGTGSGAVILALKEQLPELRAFGADISLAALRCAQENSRQLKLAVQWVQTHWLQGILQASFDLIVANPPYIAFSEQHLMNAETRHEPTSALFASDEGLSDIVEITWGAATALKPGGWLALEHGFAQAARVQQILKDCEFRDIQTREDLQGFLRVTFGRRSE